MTFKVLWWIFCIFTWVVLWENIRFPICYKAWNLYSTVQHKFSRWFLKFKALSILISSNSTSSYSLIVTDPIFRLYFKQFFFPSIINWNFPGFALSDLILNQYRRFHISCSRLLRIKGKLLPWEHKVLSSTKLQRSGFSTTRKMSVIKILQSNGPNIEPSEIPQMTLA